MLDFVSQNSVFILGTFGLLAFIINIVVEMIKDLPFIKDVPTKLITIIVSIIIMLILSPLLNIGNYIFCFVAAFPVAYISMYGYDSFIELYERFKNK